MVDELLADETVGGGADTLYALGDHLGTIRDIANFGESTSVTSVTNHRTYNSFGKLVSETNAAVDLIFGYTGKQLDEATGLQHNLFRWYDSALGQWLSEDPIGFAAGDENVRRYVGNGAISRLDPSGLDWLDTYANWFNSQVPGGQTYTNNVGDLIHAGVTTVISNEALASASAAQLTVGTIIASTGIVLGGEVLLGVGTIGQAALGAGVALADSAYALGAMRLTWAAPSLFGQGGFGLGIGGTLSATGTASAWVTGSVSVNAWWIVGPTALAMSGAGAGGGMASSPKGTIWDAPLKFRGLLNNELNKTIGGPQVDLLRKLFKGEGAVGLTRESLEAAAELSRRAILNTATTRAQVVVHQERLRLLWEAIGKL